MTTVSRLLRSHFCRFMIFACGLALFQFPTAFAAQGSNTEQAQSPIAPFRIAGTIVNAIGGNPLARARVSILDAHNPKNTQSAITAEDGRFAFRVSPGKYALQGAKRGFITATYDQHEDYSTAIVTGAAFETEHLVLRLAPSALLSGKVLDESGDPVRHATLSLYREDRREGIGRILKFQTAATDDQGAYEFAGLDAGTYFVSTASSPWYALHPVSSPQPDGENPSTTANPSLDAAYPVTYYGDSTEPDDASPIPIRGGDHLRADIHLSPVPAIHLLFHVPDNGEHGFPALQKPSFDGMDYVPNAGIQQVSPGVFEISGIAPGRYSVRVPGPRGNQGQAPADEIDVANDGQELDVSHAEPGSDIKATVHVLGESTLPQHLSVGLRNRKMRVSALQEVDAKGEIEFQNIAPGSYELLAWTRTKDFSVVRISSPAGEVSGHTLNVAAGSAPALSLSLAGGATNVEGFAKRNGKAVAGAMVVLVPKSSDSDAQLFRRDQSDQDGSFSLRSVIPGGYTVVAIENGWDLDWSRPGVIAQYAKHGQAVTVTGHTESSMHLPDPVEVQPR
jgi:protocatechuate 3,4-dioxygenase beta subunit